MLINPSLLDRFAAQPEVKLRLIRIYLETAPASLGSIEAACRGGDFEGVAWHAHALKGASSALGADQMAALSDQVQAAAKMNDAAAVDTLHRDLQRCYEKTATALTALRGATADPAEGGEPG